jgi:hypothetical protein
MKEYELVKATDVKRLQKRVKAKLSERSGGWKLHGSRFITEFIDESGEGPLRTPIYVQALVREIR